MPEEIPGEFIFKRVPKPGASITEGASLDELLKYQKDSKLGPGTSAAKFASDILDITVEKDDDVSTD